jgi:hypothetical protein
MTVKNWTNIPSNIYKYVGFVYIIENIINGRYYIGQKKFWNRIKLPPLKGKKRKRIIQKESDWQDYWGSSDELKKDIINNKKHFRRHIIECFKSKSEMNYFETKLQFEKSVLHDPLSYNKIINCRISRNQLIK